MRDGRHDQHKTFAIVARGAAARRDAVQTPGPFLPNSDDGPGSSLRYGRDDILIPSLRRRVDEHVRARQRAIGERLLACPGRASTSSRTRRNSLPISRPGERMRLVSAVTIGRILRHRRPAPPARPWPNRRRGCRFPARPGQARGRSSASPRCLRHRCRERVLAAGVEDDQPHAFGAFHAP